MLSIREDMLAKVKAIPADALRYLVFDILVILMLYFAGLNNYLLSHGLAELFVVVLHMLVFVIVWNARAYLKNDYLLFFGVALVAAIPLDLLHAFFYGIGNTSYADPETDITAQLWMTARFIEAGSLAAAPFFMRRMVKVETVLTSYAVLTGFALLSIFYWHIFPTIHVNGLTESIVERVGELVVIGLLALALALLTRMRETFDKHIYQLLVLFITVDIAAETFFVLYATASDVFNLAGHLLRIIAAYFLYRATSAASLSQTDQLLRESIREKEGELQSALTNSQQRESEMSALFQSAHEALEHHDFKDSAKTISRACKRTIGAAHAFAILRGHAGEDGELLYADGSLKVGVRGFMHAAPIRHLIESAYSVSKPIMKNDILVSLDTGNSADQYRQTAIRNVLFVPLAIHGEAVGLLAFLNKPGHFTRNDERVASTFGRIASLILHNQWTVDELRASEQKFRSVAESSANAFVTVDQIGNIVYWNERAEDIFGYPEREIISKPFSVLNLRRISPNGRPTLDDDENVELFASALPDVEVRNVEMRGRHKDGIDFPVEMSASMWRYGRERFYTAIIRDISERKTYEQKLKEYAMRMEEGKARDDALLLSIADGILVTDTDGKIIYVNKAIEELCGMSASDILERDLDSAIPFYDELGRPIPKEKRPVYIALQNGRMPAGPISTSTAFNVINLETRRRIPLSVSAAPYVIEGKTLGAVVVWRDITRENQVDKAKSEFISFASHQLRTPLTSIGLSVDMMLHHLDDAPTKEQKKYLRIAQAGIKDMSDIVETLLNISRIQMGTLVIDTEPTDLGKFTDKILQNVSIATKSRDIRVRRSYDPSVPPIKIDQRVLKIILENLLSNAMKYSPVGSTILVEVEKMDGEARIAVSDTGDGIPKEQQERIFEKLFRVQADGKVKGTGLGLYIVKAAVDQYGGKVWCESPSPRAFTNVNSRNVELGTTFYVTIPLSGMNGAKD